LSPASARPAVIDSAAPSIIALSPESLSKLVCRVLAVTAEAVLMVRR
jgi:hypothetical protein